MDEDENTETFRHPQSGDAGKPQNYSQQAPGFSGESQSRAGLAIHHELVIFCFKLTMRRFTGAGSVLRLLYNLSVCLFSLMVVRFQIFKVEFNDFWNILFTLWRQSIIVI